MASLEVNSVLCSALSNCSPLQVKNTSVSRSNVRVRARAVIINLDCHVTMMLQLLWVEHVYVWSSKISKSPQIKDYFYYIGSGSVIHEPCDTILVSQYCVCVCTVDVG